MVIDQERFHRRSLRLAGYDYRLNGAYFVTVCTQNRACLFGRVIDGKMRPNEPGMTVLDWWKRVPTKWAQVEIDAMVVMPNHMHGIIVINESFGLENGKQSAAMVGEGTVVEGDHMGRNQGDHMGRNQGDHMGSPLPERPALGDIVGWFKAMTTNAYIRGVKDAGWEPFPGRLWQRNYYEHIIRNERSLERIRGYIEGNPPRWAFDEENPDRIPSP